VWRATPRGKGSWEIQVRVRMDDAGGAIDARPVEQQTGHGLGSGMATPVPTETPLSAVEGATVESAGRIACQLGVVTLRKTATSRRV
jgi:hypothetical protein